MKPITYFLQKPLPSQCPLLSTTMMAFLFVLVFGLMASLANAQCTQWDVSGKWKAKFSAAPTVNMNFTMSGNVIKGSADFEEGMGLASVDNGRVDGDKFSLTLMWDVQETTTGSHVEYYIGTIGQDGMINGTAIIFGNNSGNAKWLSDRAMKCVGKTIHHTGRPKVTPDATPAPETTPGTMSVPGIMALPNNIKLVAGKGTGQTTLTWDGGRAHRFAEVWVKIDEANETKVIESGKGSLQVPIVPGKTYVYMLEDKGKMLASVTVKFHR